MFEKMAVVLYGEFLLDTVTPTIEIEEERFERGRELRKKFPYWVVDLISDEIQARWRQHGMNLLAEYFPSMLGPYKPELSPFKRLEKRVEKLENALKELMKQFHEQEQGT